MDERMENIKEIENDVNCERIFGEWKNIKEIEKCCVNMM